MNKISLLILSALLIAGCSSPKYTYHFDHYDYSIGKKEQVANSSVTPYNQSEPEIETSSESLTASTTDVPVVYGRRQEAPIKTEKTLEHPKKYSDMSKTEKRAFRKELRADLKEYVQSIKQGDLEAPENVKAMDNDLRLAIIFGAVGLTLSLFGGINEAFWVLGVIAIVVGVVFLIKWLVRQ